MEEGSSINSVEEIHLNVKALKAKWKQGIGLNRTQEFMTLLKLCFACNKSLNFAASRSVLYLLKWEMIDSQTVLGTLASVAGERKDVSGLINFLARVILDSNKADTINYLRYISHILIVNKAALFSVLSLFDELDTETMFEKFRPVINDLLFEVNHNRILPWIKITDRVNIHQHHTFLHWLKYSNPEDCSLALISMKKIELGIIERCFILSSVLHHQMLLGVSPGETIDLLKMLIPTVGIETHSIILLTILHGVPQYSTLYLMMILDFCDWFLDNVQLCSEVLWYMSASLLPFTKMDVFAPTLHLKVIYLIDKLNQKVTSQKNMNITINSLIIKYAVYRHNCVYESILLLRLIITFSHNKELLNSWLQNLLDHVPIKSIKSLLTMYFLYGDVITRNSSLSVLSKWHFGDVYLYLYRLNKEKCPILQYQILKTLGALCKNKFHSAAFIKILKNIKREKHENCLNLCGELYYHAWIADGQSVDDLLEIVKLEDVSDFVKATAMKAIALKSDIYCDDLIPLANKIINHSKSNKGTYATALAIDTISIMCEKGFLDVSLLWDQFMRLVAADKHPAVQKSVCYFLSMIPLVIKRFEDTSNVLYRSARLLWHFVTNPSYDKNSAVRSLKEYDLEDFDASFLSEQCQTHLKSKVKTCIPGSCWLHLIRTNDAVNIFVHLINKISKSAKFHGNYSSFFNGIIAALNDRVEKYLSSHENDEKKTIIICLKLLGANWTMIPPIGKDIGFFESLLKNSDPEIKGLSLYAVLKLYPMNDMAKTIFDNFLLKEEYNSKEKSIMCLLPSQLLSCREVNDEILFDGIYYGLCSDDSDYNSGESCKKIMLNAFQSCAADNNCPDICRRKILIIMMKVWINVPHSHQIFMTITEFMAKTYGKPLMKALPLCSPDDKMCMKYVYLSTEISLQTKSLYSFDLAVKMGSSNVRIQRETIKCLLKVLNGIGPDNINRNIKWFTRLLCSVCMNPDNFLCHILVHCANFLSGSNIYVVKESIATSLNLFPLAIVKMSNTRKMPKDLMMALCEIIRQRQVDPTFVEVFKLGILALRDDPNVPVDSGIKKIMGM